jgi:hypothetical protein
MTIRVDESIPVSIIGIDRLNKKEYIRLHLLEQWISESPETKYRYFVETLSNGSKIYLERPGRLNKGCDFVIFIENLITFQNGNDKPPKHDFIFDDLQIKKNELSQIEWDSLMNGVTEIYNCQPYNTAESHISTLPLCGLAYEIDLKLLRWFFIEQDITYWAKSGRKMLYNGILNL